MSTPGESDVKFSWKVVETPLGRRVPLFYLQFVQFPVVVGRQYTQDLLVSTYLGLGFSLVTDSEPAHLARSSGRVPGGAVWLDLTAPDTAALFMKIPEVASPVLVVRVDLTSEPGVDAQFRAEASDGVLAVLGTGFSFDEAWEPVGIQAAVDARASVVSGWVSTR
jgi:hypothetical protein